MYDLSKGFHDFYKNHVVLSAEKQNELRKKRDLNLERLKAGLKEYNEEHKTNYKISETRTQGSMAMHTVVQNDGNDYDIDVAIVFEKDNLAGKGAQAIKNVVVDALKRKCTGFATEPEAKTNCVRIVYANGYHVDFAIYRRFKESITDKEYTYEHAGSTWTSRNPAAINNWFNDEIADKGQVLRQVIRLSKMFCKSRDSWINMPGGLLQTVLCDEKLQNYDRLDEAFYYTMLEIKKRLDNSVEVNNPTDSSLSLLQTENHRQKMRNWCSRLNGKLSELDVLFDENCSETDAKNAWYKFFNHDYWSESSKSTMSESCQKSLYAFSNTEQFIEDMYNMDEQYTVKIDCIISKNGFRDMPILSFLEKFNGWLPHGFSIDCSIGYTDAPRYDMILWKVRNVGAVAEQKNMIRGQIQNRGASIHENSQFYGAHYIECYLIQENKCIAVGHVDVPIDNH